MTSFSFSSTEVLYGIVAMFLLIVGIIYFGRFYFRRKSRINLTAKYSDKQWRSPLEGRNKYPDVDVFSLSPTFFRFGLIGAIALTIAAFNWTTFEQDVEVPQDAWVMDDEVEIEIPRSAEPPPPPPPPPPPVVQEVPDGIEIEDLDDLAAFDQSIDSETVIDMTEYEANVSEETPPPPPPPPPPAPVSKVREIFKVVEEMPRFPGCEDMGGTIKEKQACAEGKLMEFIYANIEYPTLAKENGIEGTVIARFVVDANGTISDVSVLRDPGGLTAEEAIRVIELMNEMPQRWTPGKQRGRPVNVMFTMPIKFKLQYN